MNENCIFHDTRGILLFHGLRLSTTQKIERFPIVTLSLILPAYNEEKAIADTIRQCLDAKEALLEKTGLDDVEFIVVSDGSTDGTTRIAAEFEPDIRLISYPDNRGYGAAINTGFQNAKGDLLGFMDADATINPTELAKLVNEIQRTGADICLGSRLGPDSRMPLVRFLGNLFFRTLVRFLSNRRTTDVASGVRVLRRDCLNRLNPLPTDLSYTPAMSCRALLDPTLTIVETPISYSERVGDSKLSVIRDGLGFFKIIVTIGISFRPFKLFAIPGGLLVAVAIAYAVPLWANYLRLNVVPEDRIYRILFIIAAFNCGVTYLGLGALLEHVPRSIHKIAAPSWTRRWLDRVFAPAPLTVAASACWLLALASVASSIVEYVSTGRISAHWSRTALGAFLAILGAIMTAFAIAEYTVKAMRELISGDVAVQPKDNADGSE